ncbi:MAG: outer membrane lipid asymmetry maintenance protein MlaD [Gammaproteobacteria bacterium]|nr:outer membrane lipid asymmetry maintenance protein MlaD [Gammaproteobacteria bacterium]NIR82292.1 outer membrane lipid asymmetry maintenance protein MlaD [Gammaproteobacteria bacterium]NIR91223.1 outer membrane lipid asymmetry maintenance protein MlaD [Gammaproteobacteria bacterium]NIU03441.1 outer membrane lipid asymmetry maintenance protein MlaD [Gammaproteobacteria bacterium]NIX84716.1 outer membrane lipid asymmetry maintenance protein MlaD [Gammaproteobacteria bacterium]
MQTPTRTVEIVVGVFVALGLAAFVMLAMRVSNISALTETGGYDVTARFTNIGGLKVRAPVTMAGVRIGRVTDIGFDDRTYEAVVTLTVLPRYDQLPADTSASILTAGLLGEQYVGLEPGGAEDYLEQGDEIMLTQSAVVLEQLIGQFLYGKAAQ